MVEKKGMARKNGNDTIRMKGLSDRDRKGRREERKRDGEE